MPKESVEDQLRKLAKLPENQNCANCDKHDRLGFKNICIPYKTFLCGECKSAHQAYSHRIKNITMSNFTQAEVDSLKSKNGGGNHNARKLWMNSSSVKKIRPTPGGHPDDFKYFVRVVYLDKKYYDSGAEDDSSSESDYERADRRAERAQPTPSRAKAAVTSSDAIPQVNLLDIISSPVAKPAAPAPSQPPADDDFGEFLSATPATVAPAPPSVAASSAVPHQPTAAPVSNNMPWPMAGSQPASQPAALPDDDFGDFVSANGSQPQQTVPVGSMAGLNLAGNGAAPAAKPAVAAPLPDLFGMTTSPAKGGPAHGASPNAMWNSASISGGPVRPMGSPPAQPQGQPGQPIQWSAAPRPGINQLGMRSSPAMMGQPGMRPTIQPRGMMSPQTAMSSPGVMQQRPQGGMQPGMAPGQQVVPGMPVQQQWSPGVGLPNGGMGSGSPAAARPGAVPGRDVPLF